MTIAELIDEHGARAIARRLGCSHSQVVAWRRAGRCPLHVAAALVEVYGVDLRDVAPDVDDLAARAGVRPELLATVCGRGGLVVQRAREYAREGVDDGE